MSKAPNLKAVCQGKNSHEVVIAAIRQAGTLWFCSLELWLYGSGLGHYCRSIHRLGGLRAGGMSRVKFEFISAALISGRHMFLYVRVGNNASQRDIPEVTKSGYSSVALVVSARRCACLIAVWVP